MIGQGWVDRWVAKVDNVFPRLGGFAKVVIGLGKFDTYNGVVRIKLII